ncbi:MAG: MOP flippase family protein [Acidobacteriota bacterium]
MRLRNQAIAGMRWTGLATLVVGALQVFQFVVVAKLLSPADFGMIGLALVVIGFLQSYTDLGISAAIIHRQDASQDELSSLYWLNLLAGALTFAAFALASPLIIAFFKAPGLSGLMLFMSLAFLIAPLGSQFEILLRRDLRFDTLAAFEMASAAISSATTVMLAFCGLAAWALAIGYIANVAIRTLCLVAAGVRRFRVHWHFSAAEVRSYLAFGLYQLGERSVNYLVERTDQILIGHFLGVRDLGYYNFAYNLAIQPLSRINPVVTRVIFPVFSRMQNDRETLKRWYLKIVHLLTAIHAPIAGGLAVVAPLAVPLVFGEKWRPSVVLLQLLCVLALLRSTGNPIGSLLLAKGRADLGLKWNLCFFLLTTPVMLVGVHLFGSVGMVVSMLLVGLLAKIASYFYLLRPLVGSCGSQFLAALTRPLVPMAVMVAAVAGLSFWRPVVAPGYLLSLQVGGGIALYIAALGLSDQEIFSQLRLLREKESE